MVLEDRRHGRHAAGKVDEEHAQDGVAAKLIERDEARRDGGVGHGNLRQRVESSDDHRSFNAALQQGKWLGVRAIDKCDKIRVGGMSMDLLIKFPNDADVIAEEAARFRRLSPIQQVRSICDLIDTGEMLMRNSSRAEFATEYFASERNERNKAILEFVNKHGQ